MADREAGGASVRAIEQIYRNGYPRFLRVATAIVGSREAAADAVQEAFARLLRSRFDYRGEGTLEAWAWRTVTNVALTQSKQRPVVEPVATAPSNGTPEKWPELRAAVAALPERQRQALFLRHYADLSYEAIGEILGVATGTVSATLHSAHAALRRTLPELRP
ncbi:MAG TPA: sigma-70 family RNA polymerase sigma factor [Gaiellaceae bacterium]